MSTRRTFLQVTALGAVALALGGVGLGLRGTVYRAPSRPLRALSPRAFSVMAAVADRMLAYADPTLPDAAALQVAEGVDAHLAGLHPAAAAEVEQALMLLENAAAGLVLEGRITPFTSCDPASQDAILQGWAQARLPLFRTAYRAMHGLCTGVYWSSPQVYGAAGYPGPPDLSGVLGQRRVGG